MCQVLLTGVDHALMGVFGLNGEKIKTLSGLGEDKKLEESSEERKDRKQHREAHSLH